MIAIHYFHGKTTIVSLMSFVGCDIQVVKTNIEEGLEMAPAASVPLECSKL